MDGMKGRQIVMCDIPGASLQADWLKDNNCYLEFKGQIVDMICKIDPCYKNYVLTNKKTGKKKLYEKLAKAVYGTLLGAKKFYQKLSCQLLVGLLAFSFSFSSSCSCCCLK